jgi:hypothetical protein
MQTYIHRADEGVDTAEEVHTEISSSVILRLLQSHNRSCTLNHVASIEGGLLVLVGVQAID